MRRRARGQSGQVLIVGIVMMLIVLVAIFFLFDVHNIIRAKLKLETAQQAAAIAGAEWQRESLNLIGEINLIKACETLLDNDARWPNLPAGPIEDPDRLRGRIELLTEMQTRISFIGPLIGFAAAQQAAKANGLNPQDALSNYIWQLDNDWRYQSVFGGADDVIRNYRWRTPYTGLIRDIGNRGIAIFPNARLAHSPVVEPEELADPDLYEAIRLHAAEISAETLVTGHSSWHDATYTFVKSWRQSDFNDKWWQIDYSMARFPEESEIYTLGVDFSSSSDGTAGNFTSYRYELQHLVPLQSVYMAGNLPQGMRWCRYDEFWYPDYYSANYENYDQDHYNYWFEGSALRRPVKKQYRYEGPAAYAESSVNVDSISRYRLSRYPENADFDRRLYDSGIRTTWVGSRRYAQKSSQPITSSYRPGVIAKVLGELRGNTPPIAIPLILPVFDQTSLMPTYLPLPYGFSVLRTGNSILERFLNWLANEDSLFDYKYDPPGGTEEYLAMLQTLCDGPGFRYYGFNPSFDADGFDNRYASSPRELLGKWDFVYDEGTNPSGAGWLQLPQVCTIPSGDPPGQAGKTATAVDYVNGGMAQRIFITSSTYFVIDSRKHVVTNDEPDPTRRYGTIGGPGGGSGYDSGSYQPDLQTGPPRL